MVCSSEALTRTKTGNDVDDVPYVNEMRLIKIITSLPYRLYRPMSLYYMIVAIVKITVKTKEGSVKEEAMKLLRAISVD